MSMDLIFIEAVAGELREKLRGAAVSKIHQPGAAEIILRLWTGRENLRLLLSADPRASRLHLTAESPGNPQTPPRFCQLLRSRLTRLLEVERVPGERIVRLAFAGEAGRRWTLVAELLGPRANLVLLDGEERVVDALRRVEGEGEGRETVPGRIYQPPAPRPLFDLAKGVPDPPAGVSFRNWLLQAVMPMTPLLAEDLAAGVEAGQGPGEVLGDLRRRWLDREFRPQILGWGERRVLSVLPLRYLEPEAALDFDSPSAAADAFFGDGAGGTAAGGEREALERCVRKAVERAQRRLGRIEEELAAARDFERQRELGELLLSALHRLRRGADSVTVDDWFADPPIPVAIPLDPRLSPQENAEACFRRFRKAKRGIAHLEQRLGETRDELAWLDGEALAIEEAAGTADLAAVRDGLREAGTWRDRGPAPALRRLDPKDQLHKAVTPGGFTLYWGKNPRTNDFVSRRLTSQDDLWFHARDLPGCHLVLKRGEADRTVPEADILFAAGLAAGYSRGRQDAGVEVMVTEGRWVRKPKGARPGLVTVDRYRSVRVRPRRLGEER